MSRGYGRSPKGERVYLPTNGRKFKRINIVGGMLNGKRLAVMKYSWNTNTAWFNEWFEWYLCPLLNVGSVIVMDNASFHNKADLNRIASSYGCRIIWLPPYSPDKNKIEKLWANLKNWLKIHSKTFATIQDAITGYFQAK